MGALSHEHIRHAAACEQSTVHRDGAFFVPAACWPPLPREQSNPWKPSRVLRKGKHAHSRPQRRFEPLAVVSFRRALVLVMTQKATVVAADAEHPVLGAGVRATTARRSSCSRGTCASRTRGSVPVSRRGVLRRDAHRCAYCGRLGDDDRPRAAAVARRGGQLGEPRRVLPRAATTSRATARRPRWAGRSAGRRRRRTGSAGSCAASSGRSRSGTSTSPRRERVPQLPVGLASASLRLRLRLRTGFRTPHRV